MDKKNVRLTNEILNKKFKSNFILVNYAIQLAENMIKTGREARVKSELQNRAMLILEEIDAGKDVFDLIPEPQEESDIDTKKEVKARFLMDEKEYKAPQKNALRDE